MTQSNKPNPQANRTLKAQRLGARVDERQKRLIERGAALRGMSVSDFMVRSAAEAAEQAIRAQALIDLSLEGQTAFAEALRHPPEPNDALRAAFQRRLEMLEKQ